MWGLVGSLESWPFSREPFTLLWLLGPMCCLSLGLTKIIEETGAKDMLSVSGRTSDPSLAVSWPLELGQYSRGEPRGPPFSSLHPRAKSLPRPLSPAPVSSADLRDTPKSLPIPPGNKQSPNDTDFKIWRKRGEHFRVTHSSHWRGAQPWYVGYSQLIFFPMAGICLVSPSSHFAGVPPWVLAGPILPGGDGRGWDSVLMWSSGVGGFQPRHEPALLAWENLFQV